MIDDAALLRQVEAFLSEHGIPPSRLGLSALRDGALVTQMRAGRSLTLRSANRLISWMGSFAAEAEARIEIEAERLSGNKGRPPCNNS